MRAIAMLAIYGGSAMLSLWIIMKVFALASFIGLVLLVTIVGLIMYAMVKSAVKGEG
jgi:hypothetical protein